MDDMVKHIEGVTDKDAFLHFIQKLIDDYRGNLQEWENKSIDEYLGAIRSWIEDFSVSEFNNIDWNKIEYSTIAKILYMGKIYE
ncbi:MAG: hypothetical protein IJZ08_06355 [Clostridia bacterium]|nr:hypothetical protein [Clostridia bacterium]